MNGRTGKRGFIARPGDAEGWIRAAETLPARVETANGFTARLTIDITPDQRARIKIAAFRRGETVADMLRDLLAREVPAPEGETS